MESAKLSWGRGSKNQRGGGYLRLLWEGTHPHTSRRLLGNPACKHTWKSLWCSYRQPSRGMWLLRTRIHQHLLNTHKGKVVTESGDAEFGRLALSVDREGAYYLFSRSRGGEGGEGQGREGAGKLLTRTLRAVSLVTGFACTRVGAFGVRTDSIRVAFGFSGHTFINIWSCGQIQSIHC